MNKFFTLLFLPIFSAVNAQNIDFDKQPSVAWRFKVKGPIISSPVIQNGVVYFGGTDSTLYALDLASGNVKWELKTNGEIRSTVVIDNGKVFLLQGNGVLSCIDKETGKPVWRKIFDNTALFLAERKYDFADYYHSSPVVYNGVVYFGSGSGHVRAMRADTGELVWTFKTNDIVHNTPVVYRDKLVIGSFDGNLYALSLSTGAVAWKFKSVGHKYFPVGEFQGSPATGNDLIYVGGRDYNIYALDGIGGYAHWNRRFMGGWALSSTVKDTVLYIGTSDDRLLLAVDARSGQEYWKTNVKFNIFGNCVFTPSMVYVGTIWGILYGLDRKTGAVKWTFATDGYASHHEKYFKSDDTFRDDISRKLRAPIDYVQAEFSMGGIFSTPAVSGDWLVVTSGEGIVYGMKK